MICVTNVVIKSTSIKVVAAQCDKTKKSVKCRVKRLTSAVIFLFTLIIMFHRSPYNFYVLFKQILACIRHDIAHNAG
jgi:hypothetical protein